LIDKCLTPTFQTYRHTDSYKNVIIYDLILDFIVFNATFNNISAISWRPVLVVEETGLPEENYRPWASN
jgi:hypothetical protein